MKRLSSPHTSVFKLMAWLACFAAGFAACVFARVSIFGCLLFIAAAIASFFTSWRFFRSATSVFIDDEALYFDRGGKLLRIPFSAIVSVKQPMYLRYPVIVVTYETRLGTREETIF